jgi:hypothetical protein
MKKLLLVLVLLGTIVMMVPGIVQANIEDEANIVEVLAISEQKKVTVNVVSTTGWLFKKTHRTSFSFSGTDEPGGVLYYNDEDHVWETKSGTVIIPYDNFYIESWSYESEANLNQPELQVMYWIDYWESRIYWSDFLEEDDRSITFREDNSMITFFLVWDRVDPRRK